MSLVVEFKKITHAKWFPWALGAIAGIVVLYYMMRGGSSSTAASTDSSAADYASLEAQANAANAQNAQIGLASQTESDQASANMAQLNASAQAASDQNTTAAISAVGNTLSEVIGAQSELPIATVNAVAGTNQAALESAAGVSASALAATPGVISGAAQVLGASYIPEQQYGTAVENSGSVLATNSIGQGFNSSVQASGSVATSATGAAASRSAANSSEMGSLGTLAAVALLA